MRLFFRYICLAALLAVPVVLVARVAQAAEKHLGTIVNIDAGSGLGAVNNLNTVQPFRINPLVLITIQPDVAAYVCVDQILNIDAGSILSDGGAGPWSQLRIPVCQLPDGGSKGVRVEANSAFPSSCQSAGALVMPDGGFTSCAVSCVPITGTSVTCPVWQRQVNGSGPEF